MRAQPTNRPPPSSTNPPGPAASAQKVLLTMLQKEQHLVTATAPTDFQIRAAMGLSCPDDANCDPAVRRILQPGIRRRPPLPLLPEPSRRLRLPRRDGSTTCSTAPSRPAAAARSTSRTTRPHCSTSTRPISRIRPRWRPEPARATPVPPTATATSRLIYTDWFGNPRQ